MNGSPELKNRKNAPDVKVVLTVRKDVCRNATQTGEKMKHNLENPRCPDCGGISHRAGYHTTCSGKVRQYQCIVCGRSFSDNTKFVKIADIPQHISNTK